MLLLVHTFAAIPLDLHVAPCGENSLRVFGFARQLPPDAEANFHKLQETLAGEKLIPLHFVKFQRVSQVSVFFADNQGGTDDITCVSRIDLAGMTVETTNMKDFKKVG